MVEAVVEAVVAFPLRQPRLPALRLPAASVEQWSMQKKWITATP